MITNWSISGHHHNQFGPALIVCLNVACYNDIVNSVFFILLLLLLSLYERKGISGGVNFFVLFWFIWLDSKKTGQFLLWLISSYLCVCVCVFQTFLNMSTRVTHTHTQTRMIISATNDVDAHNIVQHRAESAVMMMLH